MKRPEPTSSLLILAATAVTAVVLVLGPASPAQVVPDSAPTIEGSAIERAETLFSEGSYALALEAYRAIDPDTLSPEQARWVEMRRADARWRSAAASESADTTELDEARRALEVLVRDATREEDRDRVWAEVQESLGDFWWTRRGGGDWGRAWPYYEKALDWWAGSSSIETARERYLSIVWRATQPSWERYGYFGNRIPLHVLESARRIAVDPRDRARASYLIALASRQMGGDPAASRRTDRAFEEAVESGRGTEWYDDALFQYAEWLERSGPVVRTDEGIRQVPDHLRALELYRRLVTEFRKGETRHYDPAEARIREITAPDLGLVVSNIFLPDSEVQYTVSYRNVDRIELALRPVELTRDLGFADDDDAGDWLERLADSGGEAVRRWTWATNDDGAHRPGRETLTLREGLEPGAYLLEARAAGRTARELVLVTSTALVLKTAGRRALVYVCSALDGAPATETDVVLWVRRQRNETEWSRTNGRTDEDGLIAFDLPDTESNLALFAVAGSGGGQAFGLARSWRHWQSDEPWRIYAFTDRPVYRPEDRVQFKIVARRSRDGGYVNPAGRTLRYRVVDPRGAELDEGSLELDAFGAAWAETALGRELPLGEYRVEFREADDKRSIGTATLFRVEEYKLPEFEVTVETPQTDGRPKTLRVGETVEAELVAEYYFGGPVAGAEADVVVYQRPLWVGWPEPHEFPWFYDEVSPMRHYGRGQVVENLRVTTDATGRAAVRFDTPMSSGQDYEYTIEARVRDASRREVVGRGSVRVTRQRYFASLHAEHRIYQPGDTVALELRTYDANRQPLTADGRVEVTRERWVEVWSDPRGREVRGAALARQRDRLDEPGWTLVSRGYEEEQILDRPIRTTGEDALAEIRFEAEEEGYYRVRFTGDSLADYPVEGETRVWVADSDTRDVGYHHGGLEILVDRDTLRAGGIVPVMISVPASGAWVLFTVEGETLHDWRLVRVDGTVKLIEVEIDERHVPNVFFGAAMVEDGQLFLDTREAIVPPVDQFLDVELEFDRESYLPGETGRLDVTTRDHDGRPVAAEVALSLVDASVFYVQSDLAGDIRQFFYGSKRSRAVQTSSTFHWKPFARRVDESGGRDDRGRLQSIADRAVSGREMAQMEVAEGAAVPAAAEYRATEKMATDESLADADTALQTGGSTVVVRTDFRATALWSPAVVTDEAGRASVEFEFPHTLTAWRATARVADRTARFGTTEETGRTRKPLIVRLQAPRFFTVGDETTVSAVVNNHSERDLDVRVSLEAHGLDTGGSIERTLRIVAGGEARVDWPVDARGAGRAELTVRAAGGGLDDAMRKTYPVHPHGIEKLVYRSGKVRGDEVEITLPLPAERRTGSTTASVRVTPSLAVTMLDALPYLIDYPYGCTEQTMSRFLPSVIVARTLETLGLEPQAVAERIFGGIERDVVDRTHPEGPAAVGELDAMVEAGLARLYDFQHADGGWGWWKQGDSDPYMSGYVVWGLALAREAGIEIRSETMGRAVEYLDRSLVDAEEQPDLQSWMLHALAVATDRGAPTPFQRTALDNLWERRDRLNAYTRALLALAHHELGEDERAETLVRNLVNGVRRDPTPDRSVVVRGGAGASGPGVIGTAHWGEDRRWWRWSDGAIESTSFALRALLAIDPQSDLIEPATVWLIRNRRGAQWTNTRDTAFAVLALTDYLQVSGELTKSLEFELIVNDRSVATARVEPGDLLRAPAGFEIDPGLLRDGDNRIRIVRRSGDGEIYFAAQAEYFSLEEPIQPAGHEVWVRRQYERRIPRPTLLKGFVTDTAPLEDGGTAFGGERIEVILTLESKNDYEYLVIEDLKPAGLEAVQIRSDEPIYARELKADAAARAESEREAGDYTGRSQRLHQELRDRQVALFVDKLPQGFWEIRYELRAEVPGRYHGLPTKVHAMYVPEIRANGAEIRIGIEDRESGQ